MTVGYGSLAKVVAPVHAKVPAITVHRLWFGLSFSVHCYHGVSITIVLGREKVCSNLEFVVQHWRKSGMAAKPRTWRQKLMQKQKRNAAYWTIPCGLLNFLSYNTKGHLLLDDTSHSELGPSTLSSIKKIPPPLSFAHRPIIVRAFSQLRFPLFKWLLLVSSWHKSR